MKANAGQIATAIDRAAAGNGDIRLFLIHGPDESGAMELAARMARAIGADAERIDLDGASLKAQPGRLADEAASLSLFGGKRFVRVTAMGEESLEAVTLLLGLPVAGTPVVAIAPSVKASGKLVKLALSAPAAMAFACYVPEGADAARIAANIAREQGVRLTGSTAATMVAGAGGDRAILTREIEKLALYLDAAPDRPKEADEDVLARIGANIDDSEMARAIAAVIDGAPAVFGPEMAGVEAAGMAIPMLRGLSRRLIALADMRAEVDSGASAESVVEKHRVFWKEKASTIRALRRWTAPQIAAGVARVRRAERGILSGGGAASVTVAHDTLAIAGAAARR
ncbi:DNA polymerase III subunit delta [Sphingomonas donggukensis]|uniref:DNA-directed DNA polymerase n=1 Tax=Sphingomonas donggukensis TaxID=2949093 RepID=A0ABY4TSA0_9SPHN|nr:DNA polymerase III subunit delta [Sphingomonas donggukensis]URW75285.1 DNA polymerase III subunit delta [Sphingomonas donggukensis]